MSKTILAFVSIEAHRAAVLQAAALNKPRLFFLLFQQHLVLLLILLVYAAELLAAAKPGQADRAGRPKGSPAVYTSQKFYSTVINWKVWRMESP